MLFGLREGEQASEERLGLGPEEGETEGHVSFLWGNGGNDRQQAASAAKSPALWGHTAFLARLCSSILAREEPDPWSSSWAFQVRILC